MKLVLVGVGQDQVDVVVGEVDEDEPWEEEERTWGYSQRSTARGEGQTDHAYDEGDDGTEDGGDVDGEVEGYLVQEVLRLVYDWTKAYI